MNLLKGKLTYLMAILAILAGIGDLAFGWTDHATAINTIWIGLTAFGLRRAVA